MDRTALAKELRSIEEPHYNCAQAVLATYADRMGITADQARAMGANFGGGMRHGATCGAVTGALMVLGMAGLDEQTAARLLREFRQSHGALDCATLLKGAKERSVPRTAHCDGLVLDAVALLETLLSEEGAPKPETEADTPGDGSNQ